MVHSLQKEADKPEVLEKRKVKSEARKDRKKEQAKVAAETADAGN